MSYSILFSSLSIILEGFDHRSYAGASTIPQIAALASAVFGMLGFLLFRFENFGLYKKASIGVIVSIYFMVGYVALIRDVDLANMAKAAGSLFLILPALLAAYTILSASRDFDNGIRVILLSLVIQLAVRFANGFLNAGVGLDQMRWQILSPVMHDALGFGVFGLIYLRRGLLLSLTAIFLAVGIGVISVTRGLVVPFAIVTIFQLGFALVYKSRLAEMGLEVSTVAKRTVILALVAVGAFAAVAALRPMVIADWTDRIIGNKTAVGKDLTYLTREAEVVDQWKRTIVSPSKIVAGNGYGAMYFWDESYRKEISAFTRDTGYFTEGVFVPGHVTWAYSFFAGGAIGTLFTLGVYLVPLWMNFLGAFKAMRLPYVPHYVSGLAIMTVVNILSTLALSFTGNPIGDRVGGYFAGVYIGLAWWVSDCILRGNEPTTEYRS